MLYSSFRRKKGGISAARAEKDESTNTFFANSAIRIANEGMGNLYDYIDNHFKESVLNWTYKNSEAEFQFTFGGRSRAEWGSNQEVTNEAVMEKLGHILPEVVIGGKRYPNLTLGMVRILTLSRIESTQEPPSWEYFNWLHGQCSSVINDDIIENIGAAFKDEAVLYCMFFVHARALANEQPGASRQRRDVLAGAILEPSIMKCIVEQLSQQFSMGSNGRINYAAIANAYNDLGYFIETSEAMAMLSSRMRDQLEPFLKLYEWDNNPKMSTSLAYSYYTRALAICARKFKDTNIVFSGYGKRKLEEFIAISKAATVNNSIYTVAPARNRNNNNNNGPSAATDRSIEGFEHQSEDDQGDAGRSLMGDSGTPESSHLDELKGSSVPAESGSMPNQREPIASNGSSSQAVIAPSSRYRPQRTRPLVNSSNSSSRTNTNNSNNSARRNAGSNNAQLPNGGSSSSSSSSSGASPEIMSVLSLLSDKLGSLSGTIDSLTTRLNESEAKNEKLLSILDSKPKLVISEPVARINISALNNNASQFIPGNEKSQVLVKPSKEPSSDTVAAKPPPKKEAIEKKVTAAVAAVKPIESKETGQKGAEEQFVSKFIELDNGMFSDENFKYEGFDNLKDLGILRQTVANLASGLKGKPPSVRPTLYELQNGVWVSVLKFSPGAIGFKLSLGEGDLITLRANRD